MSVETRLRSAAEDTREKISGLTTPPVRHRHRRAVWGWAVAGLAVVSVLVFLAPRLTTDQRVIAEPAPGESILLEGPPTLVVRGAESPEPGFDTTALGEEVVLRGVDDLELTRLVAAIETADPEPLGGQLAKITVVGTLSDGSTIALLSGGSAEPDACIWQASPANGYSCFGLPDLKTPITSTFAGTTTWGPLPANTSVAQLIRGDERYWQRPVGRVAAFDIEAPVESGGYMLKAFDANGNIVHMEGQLVETEVPGFGVLTLSTAQGNVEGLGEATCLYLSTPDAISGSGVRPESSAICGESISTEALGIYPSEICRPEEGDHVGIIALVGLPEGDPEVTLTLGDGTRETVPSNNGAAVWAWNNAKNLINIEIPGIDTELIAGAVDLPMGSCN